MALADPMEGYPPPVPPVQSKLDLMNKYKDELDEAEQKALRAPAELNDCFADLVAYLTEDAQNDLVKVRAFLFWLSKQNFLLAVDEDAADDGTPKGFLKLIARKEKSLAQLLAKLCRKAQVPCVVLSGFCKRSLDVRVNWDDMQSSDKPETPAVNSSWVAVYVEKQWGFIEPLQALADIRVERPKCLKIEATGKAIHEGNHMTVAGSIDETFFLPDPEDFIYMCRPEKDDWQLLKDRPWTWQQFMDAPDTKPEPETTGSDTPDSEPTSLSETLKDYPPPTPPEQRRKDLMNKYAGEMYKIDGKAAPAELNDSFADLVAYLTADAKNDLFKVRAFFFWLSKQNFLLAVDEDAEDEGTPKGFLKLIARKEKSLAQLLAKLCRIDGIPCVVLSGYHKRSMDVKHAWRYMSSSDKPETPTVNSSWVAVYVEKQWGFIEPLLALRDIRVERPKCLKIEATGKAIHGGSSHMTVEGYVNETFFLPDPEDFIYMCRPEKDDWQLLEDEPWTWQQFMDAPDTKPKPPPEPKPEPEPEPEPQPIRPASPVSLPVERLSVPDSQDGDPPPQPPKTKKADIISKEETERIDRRAIQAPKELYQSYEDLFGYLFESLDTDVKKARALLSWMIANWNRYRANISREMLLNVTDPHTPLGFIKLRTETASLSVEQYFAVLCRQAGLPCRLIRGQKKTPTSYELGEETTREKYVWTAVYLDGCWRFVDVYSFIYGVEECDISMRTDARGTREIKTYRQVTKFKEFFFLTEPDEFIHFCFPDDEDWQLLEQPFSAKQFFHEPWIRPPYFHSPFKLHLDSSACLEAKDGLASVLFQGQASKQNVLKYNLYYVQKDCYDVFPEDKDLESYISTAVVSKKPPLTSMFFNLPKVGTYILEPLNSSEETLCKLLIRCFGDITQNNPLPGDPSIGYGYQQAAEDAGLEKPSREEGMIFAREGERVNFSFRKRSPQTPRVEPEPIATKATAAEGERVKMRFAAKILESGGKDNAKYRIKTKQDDHQFEVKALIPPAIQTGNVAVAILTCGEEGNKIVMNYLVTSDQHLVASSSGRTVAEQAKTELIAATKSDDMNRLTSAMREYRRTREASVKASVYVQAEKKLVTVHEKALEQALGVNDLEELDEVMKSAKRCHVTSPLLESPYVKTALENLRRTEPKKRAAKKGT